MIPATARRLDKTYLTAYEYEESNDSITASFDLSHAKFICMEDIRRDQAVAILTKLMHKLPIVVPTRTSHYPYKG